MTEELSARVIEVYFFYLKCSNGEVDQSSCYNTLEEALDARDARLTEYEEISPVIKGYI